MPYLVPTDDFHASEYVGDLFKCREYLTGPTGSAGTAVSLAVKNEAGLWMDGRHFLQAAKETFEEADFCSDGSENRISDSERFTWKSHLNQGQDAGI